MNTRAVVSRLWWRAPFARSLLMMVVALALAPVPVAAATRPIGPAGKQIDWTHPFVVPLPGPGQPRSGVGTPASITPEANFPQGCYQGIAYNVIVEHQTLWFATNGSVEAWVEYQWCPRWAGDRVGLNWAYGRAYLSGCGNVYVGDLNPPFSNPLGPLLRDQYGDEWDDDEYFTAYGVCNGYAWDYSTTAPGSGLYEVWMFAQTDHNELAIAHSPCYC